METTEVRIVQNHNAGLIAGNEFDVTDKLHMYKSTFNPVPTSDETDFLANEVAFTGYAPFVMVLTWDHGVGALGEALMIYRGLARFEQTNTVATDLAGGWFLMDTGSGILYAHGKFDDPIAWDHTGNIALIKPSIYFTKLANADVEVIYGP